MKQEIDTEALLNMSLDEIIAAGKQHQDKASNPQRKPQKKLVNGLTEGKQSSALGKKKKVQVQVKQQGLGTRAIIAKKKAALKPVTAASKKPKQLQSLPQKGAMAVTIKNKSIAPIHFKQRPQQSNSQQRGGKAGQSNSQGRPSAQPRGPQRNGLNKPANAGISKQQRYQKPGAKVVVSIQGQQAAGSNGPLTNRQGPVKPAKKGFNNFGVKLPV